MTIQVFVAEDSPLLAERLIQLIEEGGDMTVIGHTGSLDAVRPQIGRLAPDVALLDIHLQGGSTFEVLSDLRREMPALGIVLMTESNYTGYRRKALERGADEFLDKSQAFESIVPVLRRLGQEARG